MLLKQRYSFRIINHRILYFINLLIKRLLLLINNYSSLSRIYIYINNKNYKIQE